MKMAVRCLILLGAASLMAGCGGRKAGKSEFIIAAAADLRFAMDELVSRFQRSHPGSKIRPIYGSSGQFDSQIRNGAPYDMYFSADQTYPARLGAEGYGLGGVFPYAVGRIVLWVPADSPLKLDRGLKALLDPSVRNVAIANPGHAPYGRAAVAALQSYGVYEAIQTKLVYGENVSQAWQYARLRSAQAGIIAVSLALAPDAGHEGRYWEIPVSAYPRIDQGALILKQTTQPKIALAFRAFVTGAEGKAVLKRYGFYLPGD